MKKFDFIIKILLSEMDRQIGKAVQESLLNGVINFNPKNEKMKALNQAIKILEEYNKSR
jgi:hypothetical protein